MYCAIILVEPIKSKATVIKLCLYIPLGQTVNHFFPFKIKICPRVPQTASNSNYKYLLDQFP